MLSQLQIESKLKELKPALKQNFFVEKIGYFGSYSSNQQTATSDLDILVELSKPIGWNFLTLEKFLESQLNLKIDLVTKNALKKQLREQILKQVKYV